ncbi:MAG TPA: type II secretion system minor pseudopilin GspI [Steroidobacteraceae bacterium]|jgi:general secretion pathway protein I
MSSRQPRGFTLIEVLVALAIVTLGMAALLSTLSSSADGAAYQRDKTFAEWVALNRLAETRLALQRPTKGTSDGEVELAGRKWKWSQEVMETEIKGVMRIDVSVRPSDVPSAGDRSWFTTVSAITGDALVPPSGALDPFAQQRSGGPPGGPGGPTRPGVNPEPGTGGTRPPPNQTPQPSPPPTVRPPNTTD